MYEIFFIYFIKKKQRYIETGQHNIILLPNKFRFKSITAFTMAAWRYHKTMCNECNNAILASNSKWDRYCTCAPGRVTYEDDMSLLSFNVYVWWKYYIENRFFLSFRPLYEMLIERCSKQNLSYFLIFLTRLRSSAAKFWTIFLLV